MSDQPADTSPQIEYDRLDNMNCPACGALVDLAGIEPFSTIECPACGAAVEVPAKFAHFRLIKKLGSGGMGTTFLAEDEGLDRKVAIKVMQNFMAEDPKAFDTFKNEAQSAARLNHPHVAQVYSFGREKGVPYLEMELVPGGDLSKFIADGTVLDPAFVIRVGMEIAEGLKAAEEVGLFHGDVKPENILFDENMNAKLVDFGLASRATAGKSDELWGTPYYIAPEKVQKKMNSARSDIFSLGATLYHAIAGKPPFDGADAVEVIKARFKGPATPLDQVRPGVEPEVARIVTRMMYSDLFQRYPNYNSLIGDMKKYLTAIPKLRKQGPKAAVAVLTRKNATGLVEPDGATAAAAAPVSGSKKKFVITKGSMEAAEARKQMEDAAAAAGAAPSQKSGGKIVLKKHGGSVLGPLPAGEGAGAPGAAPAEEFEPVLGPDGQPVLGPDGKPVLKKKKKKTGKGCLIALLVGLVVLVAGTVTGVSMYQKKLRRQAAHLAGLREKAAQVERDYAGLSAMIEAPLSAIRRRDEEAAKIFAGLNDLCEKATGGRFEVPDLEPDLPPEPTAEELAAMQAMGEALMGAMTNALIQAVGGMTNALAGAVAADAGGAPAPAAAAPAPAPKPKAAKRSAFKILSEMYAEANGYELASAQDLLRQEAKSFGKTAEDYAKEVLAKEGVEIDDSGELVQAEPAAGDGASYGVVDGGGAAEPEPSEHPFFGQVGNALWGPAREIREALRRCERLAAREAATFEPIPPVENTLAFESAEKVLLEAIETRESAFTARKDLVAQAKTLSRKADAALKTIKSKKRDLEREGKRYQGERERKLKAEREEREAREAEERARQEEIARQAVADEEVARVRSVAEKFKPRILVFEYDGFVEALEKMRKELSQPESQEELRWTLERVQRVKDLRQWIVTDLRRNGMLRFGYQRKFDIQGVTSNGRELLLPPPKPNVPISKLETKDWLLLIQMLIEKRSPERRQLNTMERGELFLNAALFCYLHGGDNYAAINLCKKYAEQAISLRTAYKHDAHKLIPILGGDDDGGDGGDADGDGSAL